MTSVQHQVLANFLNTVGPAACGITSANFPFAVSTLNEVVFVVSLGDKELVTSSTSAEEAVVSLVVATDENSSVGVSFETLVVEGGGETGSVVCTGSDVREDSDEGSSMNIFWLGV